MEEVLHGFGSDREEFVIHGNANTRLTFVHTEGAAQFNFVFQIIFRDQMLELFNDLTRTLDVAGTADTYCDFHICDHTFLPYRIRCRGIGCKSCIL